MKFLATIAVIAATVSAAPAAATPKVLICSDSTTANYNTTTSVLQGWGYYLHDYLTIPVSNLAVNGRSTRSFINEGRWTSLLASTNAGDFVLIEMGHNDDTDPTNDTNARGTLPGIGEETVVVTTAKGQQTVHTFGWYLRKMIADVMAKKAIPVISGMVPRNYWKGDKLQSDWPFADYAKQVARAANVTYVAHTDYSVARFQALGPTKAKTYFPNDNTHTNPAGAVINADAFATAVKCGSKNALQPFLNAKGNSFACT